MTNTLTLVAEKRNPSRQINRELRNKRRVLGVVYGHGRTPMPVSVDASDVLRAYRKVGTSTLINLEVDGEKIVVLMKEVSLHPVRHEINHVDFFAANLKEKAVVHVPLKFMGESPAVKLGGMMFITHKSLNIRCLPTDSPREIEVPLEMLEKPGDYISVADLKIDSKKYEVVGLKMEEIICLVKAKRAGKTEETTSEAEQQVEKTDEEKPTE